MIFEFLFMAAGILAAGLFNILENFFNAVKIYKKSIHLLTRQVGGAL